jgi:hypothetical protein
MKLVSMLTYPTMMKRCTHRSLMHQPIIRCYLVMMLEMWECLQSSQKLLAQLDLVCLRSLNLLPPIKSLLSHPLAGVAKSVHLLLLSSPIQFLQLIR